MYTDVRCALCNVQLHNAHLTQECAHECGNALIVNEFQAESEYFILLDVRNDRTEILPEKRSSILICTFWTLITVRLEYRRRQVVVLIV